MKMATIPCTTPVCRSVPCQSPLPRCPNFSLTGKVGRAPNSESWQWMGSPIGRRRSTRSELNAVDGDRDATVMDDKARAALEQLDSQLSALAEKEVSEKRDSKYLESSQEKALGAAGFKIREWPEISNRSLVFAAIGLLLLTIVNNVLFRIFLGPPVPKRVRSSRSDLRPQTDSTFESLGAPPITNER